jgi:hypothetical protein
MRQVNSDLKIKQTYDAKPSKKIAKNSEGIKL